MVDKTRGCKQRINNRRYKIEALQTQVKAIIEKIKVLPSTTAIKYFEEDITVLKKRSKHLIDQKLKMKKKVLTSMAWWHSSIS